MQRLAKPLALILMGIGLAVIAMGAVNFQRANEGLRSLDAVYTVQGVELSYNEAGDLVDRGTTEGADAIMALLTEDWQYPVNMADFDANDPVVNTPSELMFQYATISYHVLHGTQTIVLDEAVEYNGELFEAGTYEFAVDGRYWTDFDRQHPLEGPARAMAWSPTAHGLLAEIAAGVAADYQAGFAHFAAWRTVIEGLAFVIGGLGLFAVASKEQETFLATEKAIAEEKELTTI